MSGPASGCGSDEQVYERLVKAAACWRVRHCRHAGVVLADHGSFHASLLQHRADARHIVRHSGGARLGVAQRVLHVHGQAPRQERGARRRAHLVNVVPPEDGARRCQRVHSWRRDLGVGRLRAPIDAAGEANSAVPQIVNDDHENDAGGCTGLRWRQRSRHCRRRATRLQRQTEQQPASREKGRHGARIYMCACDQCGLQSRGQGEGQDEVSIVSWRAGSCRVAAPRPAESQPAAGGARDQRVSHTNSPDSLGGVRRTRLSGDSPVRSHFEPPSLFCIAERFKGELEERSTGGWG